MAVAAAVIMAVAVTAEVRLMAVVHAEEVVQADGDEVSNR